MTARARSAVLVAVAATAVALSGCTASGWEPEAPPAAGAQAELQNLDKARNMMFVVDESGEGFLLGTIASVQGAEVTGIAYRPEIADGSFGEPATIEFTADIPKKGAIRLDDESVAVSNPELSPGHLADLVIQLSSGALQFQVPVYAADHPDYQHLFS